MIVVAFKQMFVQQYLDAVFDRHPFFAQPTVVVVSDKQLQEMREAKVKEQIKVLKSRAKQQRLQLASTEDAIAELSASLTLLTPDSTEEPKDTSN